MKSVMERRLINGRKQTSADKKQAEISLLFLKTKYELARMFFAMLGKLKLAGRDRKQWLGIFGYFYLADKLTQRCTFGRYDGTKPERGSKYVDYTSVSPVPTWFSQSVEVDENR